MIRFSAFRVLGFMALALSASSAQAAFFRCEVSIVRPSQRIERRMEVRYDRARPGELVANLSTIGIIGNSEYTLGAVNSDGLPVLQVFRTVDHGRHVVPEGLRNQAPSPRYLPMPKTLRTPARCALLQVFDDRALLSHVSEGEDSCAYFRGDEAFVRFQRFDGLFQARCQLR